MKYLDIKKGIRVRTMRIKQLIKAKDFGKMESLKGKRSSKVETGFTRLEDRVK